MHIAEIEEKRKKVEDEKLHIAQLYELQAINTAQRHLEVENVEQCYAEQKYVSQDPSSTSPLLLDAIVTPLFEPSCSCLPLSDICTSRCKQELESARHERDNALLLARQYRDMVEQSQEEKRKLKTELEKKVEVVRNFWRNKVVEGGSRSGQILRAALIKK